MHVGTVLLTLMSIWMGALPAHAGNGWSEVARPAAGAPRVIGSYAAGCIAGAAALPLVGEGYQVMRPSRNRYYGHPRLVALVQRLGRHAATHGSRALIGDLAQPRGGPMPNGHRSHQVGLDVDVWFLQQDGGRVLSREESEQAVSPSVIRAAEGEVDSSRWNSLDAELMKLAAESAEVDRIFVNPVIKRALCSTETQRDWLAKVRPWWGHDAHFHVRLACPAGAAECEPQQPFPPGDGCDADLERWVEEIREAAISPKVLPAPKPPSAKDLPVACAAVLKARVTRRR